MVDQTGAHRVVVNIPDKFDKFQGVGVAVAKYRGRPIRDSCSNVVILFFSQLAQPVLTDFINAPGGSFVVLQIVAWPLKAPLFTTGANKNLIT